MDKTTNDTNTPRKTLHFVNQWDCFDHSLKPWLDPVVNVKQTLLN